MQIVEILSHELRSPITTIHLGTKVLAANGGDIPAPVRDEVVEAVEVEAERLYRLVEDLLAVARHDGGANPLPVAPLLLQHWLLGWSRARCGRTAGCASGPASRPTCRRSLADDGALVHVVRNLLANAARYARRRACRSRSWRPGADAGTVALDVLDRGPGFERRRGERLFEPFYRAAARRGVRVRGRPRPRGGAAADAGDGRGPRRGGPRRRRRAVPVRLQVARPDDDAEADTPRSS